MPEQPDFQGVAEPDKIGGGLRATLAGREPARSAGAIRQASRSIYRGFAAGIRARRRVFGLVTLGVFVYTLFAPVVVLSIARKPVDHFTFNPWLTRLPEWLASGDVPLTRKLEFLSQLAIAWFSADNPVEGLEWGFLVDVPSLVQFTFTSLLFGAYFALWLHYRDQVRHYGWGMRAGRYGGVGGAFTSVLGFSTSACSVVGCGVPVLPVVGLAITGVSSGTLVFFGQLARVSTMVVLFAMTLGVAWLGWLVSALPDEGQLPRASTSPDDRRTE